MAYDEEAQIAKATALVEAEIKENVAAAKEEAEKERAAKKLRAGVGIQLSDTDKK